MEKVKITKEYFEKVVRESKNTLFQLSFGILKNMTDAEDAVAESLEMAWKRREQIREPEKLWGWLMAIVVNTSKTLYQKRSREIVMDIREMPIMETVEDVEKSDIWLAVAELGENHREVLLLYYYDGYSVKEIAEMFKVPEGTIKSRLSRARKELEHMLLDETEEDHENKQQKK